MPVHWFYNPDDIKRQFGRIEGYAAPRDKHPSSIMPLSSTGGHGRGGQEGRVIGDVICHGKHKFWGQKQMHYHQGMAAGENTLNALCARHAPSRFSILLRNFYIGARALLGPPHTCAERRSRLRRARAAHRCVCCHTHRCRSSSKLVLRPRSSSDGAAS